MENEEKIVSQAHTQEDDGGDDAPNLTSTAEERGDNNGVQNKCACTQEVAEFYAPGVWWTDIGLEERLALWEIEGVTETGIG